MGLLGTLWNSRSQGDYRENIGTLEEIISVKDLGGSRGGRGGSRGTIGILIGGFLGNG